MTFKFVTYATVAFQDNSIWCLGQQSWNVHYAGQVTPAGNSINYTPAAGNADNGGAGFGAGVRNNANPSAIGPMTAYRGGQGWR